MGGRSLAVNRSRVEEWSLFALAALVALLFLAAEGSPDVGIWLDWIRRTLRLGLVAGYADIQIDYPPLGVTLLHGVGLLSRKLGVSLFVGLKASLLVALLLTGVTLWRCGRDVALAAGLVAVLVPCSVGLGYLDVYYAPLLLLALFSLQQDRFARAGFFFAAACLVKWQPLVIAPFVCAYLWKRGPLAWKRALAAAAVPVAAAFLVFGPEIVRALGRALQHRGLSLNALNLWWLVTHSLHATSPDAFGALSAGTAGHIYVPYGALFQILVLRLPFLLAYTAVFVAFWRHPPAFPMLVRHALVGYVAYFMLATGVHENHLFPAVILAAVLALQPGGRRAFLIWASILNVNLWVFYGASGRLPVHRVLAGLDLAVPLAALSLWFFALALVALRDEAW